MSTNKMQCLALELAQQAGRIQMKKFRTVLDIRWKGATDPVTEVDQACEKLIVQGILKAYPDHAILGEESGKHGNPGADHQWIIDPLDGTVNYSHGLPSFAVSIGVYRKGQPYCGVVHAPALHETFRAVKGQGAFLNDKRIRVSQSKDPLASLLSSGFSYGARVSGENLREWMGVLRNFQAIRRMGSAALDLCWTAAGRFDAFWEYGLKPWDVAAAGLIVTEAGGLITNIQGKPYDMHKPGIVASNPYLQKTLLKTLKRSLATRLAWPPR